ncbi:flagellar hook assembly protein FlgD [Terrilactibacillus sp. BCM23-1]|uniref:Flagellar hook assembly protein FlgD n=1 Tax=Terrilactibacillus tamarindi TaxID=2599694 RepID=A0A6N8CTH7_9BACI|nr:flagellar hook assembly protein FlgD [Terrilactibacillus tamarindi]MTT32275.1 flagellar hook assembly protein FlgD [Terrilactibacillus tamarindi]
MVVEAASNDYYLPKKSEHTSTSNGILGKDDFLKILITQLKNQDPTQPMDDKSFIAQMASFTTLEQTQNMNGILEKFVNGQSQNQLSNLSTMIGKQIEWNSPSTDDEGNTTTQLISSTIKSVTMKNGSVEYLTNDNQTLSPSQIVTVSEGHDINV